MPLTVATLYSARGDSSNAATYVAPRFTPTIGCLLLGWVANSKTSAPDTPAISDSRFTWTRIASKNAGSLQILHVFRAMAGTGGTTPAQGGATIGFPASQTGCAWGFLEISGVPSSSDGSSSIIQYASNTFGSVVTTSTTTLSALSRSSNSVFSGLSLGVNSNPTKETAYTGAATHPGYNTPASRLGMSWLNSADTEVTPSWSWTGNYTPAEIALEVFSYGVSRNVVTSNGTLGFQGDFDNFNRADGNLTTPWSWIVGGEGLKVVSNQCQKITPAVEDSSSMSYLGGYCAGSISEQFSQFSFIDGTNISVLLRSTATQMYKVDLADYDTVYLRRYTEIDGWTDDPVSLSGSTAVPGDIFRVEVTGTTSSATFSVYLNGSPWGTIVNGSQALIGGYPGMMLYGGNSIVDNWAGGPLSSGRIRWFKRAVEAASSVVRTIPLIRAVIPATQRIVEYIRRYSLIRTVSPVVTRLANYKKTVSFTRALQYLAGRSRVLSRNSSITRSLVDAVVYSRSLIRRVGLVNARLFAISRLRWLKNTVTTIRPISFVVKRLANYRKSIAVARSLLYRAGRTAVFGRTAAITRVLTSTVRYSRWLIRRLSVVSSRLFTISRLRWLKNVVSTIRSASSSVRRLVNYKKTVSVARSLLSRAGRAAVFARTITIVRSLRSVVEREWDLFVRRVAVQRPTTFVVKRIAQLIRRVSLVSSRLLAVGRSVSGQLTLRSVATIRAISLSVKRIATYKKTIGITRALLFTVGRWRVSIRTIATTRTLLGSAKRLSWRIRNLVNARTRVFAVKRISWYKRPITFGRITTPTVKRISQIGRRVSTSTRATFRLIWHVAGALTTRTLATVGRVSDNVTRITWRIRRATLTRASSGRVIYSRWLKRVLSRSGVNAFAVGRSVWYIRRAVTAIRNNFVISTMITSVLRIWKAVSSSYPNASASSSSTKKIEVSSSSRQKERVS
jgi:hypothetical protein